MAQTRGFTLPAFLLCLALGATPGLAARSSRDALSKPQGKLGPDLFVAITHGDVAGLQSLLAHGADPNARESLEGTALLDAAGFGQVAMVEALLRAGARLDEATIYGTPLTAAAAGASAPVVRLLLDRGANPNALRPDGTTPLMYAAFNGSAEIVQELLNRKADVNAKDSDGATALIDAAREGHVEIGRLLLSRGATIDAADSHRWTALMYAAVNGHAEFVKLLLEKGANVNAREAKGRTPLILVATYGDFPAVIRALLEGGANPRATDARHRTALALATARGRGETALLLSERGVERTHAAGNVPRRTPKEAAQVSLALLQRSMRVFNATTGCVSCHHEGLGRLATGAAQQHGFVIDPVVARAQSERFSKVMAAVRPVNLKALQDPSTMKYVPAVDVADVTAYYAYLLAGMVAQRQPATPALSAATMVLARQQFPDGHWFSGPRGPMQSSFFTITALTIQVLKAYGPKNKAMEVADRLRHAKTWLQTAPAQTSEDKALRLLGLKWVGATMDERGKAIAELRADQRPDGGWPQPGASQSDAYGTGQALYALCVAGGLPVTDPIYQRGVQFLLSTQEEDGSWFVTKRVPQLNNYFDAAFPHGESQYASFNATCWATMALVQSIAPPPVTARRAARIGWHSDRRPRRMSVDREKGRRASNWADA